MLTLTRKLNESILIGNVKITVTKIHGGKIRLGIDAPKDVTVLREEVLARMVAANQDSTPSTTAKDQRRKPVVLLKGNQ